MKRLNALLFAGILLALPALAQGGAGGYSKMSVKADSMTGNMNTGRPEKLSGGVEIELIALDSGRSNLPIRANTVTFSWRDGLPTPVAITMQGNVDINHPDAHIRSQRADWNMETGELVFTGDPVLESEEFDELRAGEIRINLETGDYELSNGVQVKEMPIQGDANGGGGGNGGNNIPGLLTEGDITDWAAFLNTIKSQAAADGENPGKQLLSRLGDTPRNMLLNTDTEVLVGAKGQVLDQLNGVLKRPGMFNRSAWAGIALSEEIESLLLITNQTPEQQVRQNRLLLHAAYPDLVKGL